VRPTIRNTRLTNRYSTMATPFQIQVEPQNSGLLELKLGQSEASRVTDLLQKDLEVLHSSSVYISQRLTRYRTIMSSSTSQASTTM
jgi:hypothetical protein